MVNKQTTVKKVLIGAGLLGLGLVGKTVYDYKKEESKQSFQSWSLERLFGMVSYPLKQFESQTLYEKGLEKIADKTEKPIKIPKFDPIKVSEVYLQGMQTIVFNDKQDMDQQVIFYLHGGGYILPAAPPHFRTVEDIIQQTDAKVVMPIYPKVPKFNYKDAYPKVIQAYRETVAQTGSPKNITLMGDSAGGGFALGLSHLLADENISQPKQLILISPWLDASSENSDMEKFEKSDTVSPSQTYLQETGRLWAGGEENIYNPLVSPLYTEHREALPSITIFAGGEEMLYPDILKFQSYMKEAGREVHLHVKEKMVHDYVIFDTPEGQEARALISHLILAER